MNKLFIIASLMGFATSCYCSDDLKDEPTSQVCCETKTTCSEQKVKIVYRDKPVEKIVYRDKIIEKIVYKDKLVWRDKPVEKLVYQEKIVNKPITLTKVEQGGKLNLSLLAGMGKNGFYTELDESNDQYTMYSAWGIIGGLQGSYRFDNDITLGAGVLSNESVFASFGMNFFK